ncbi:MAG: hypothetical protein ACTHZX_09135 [Microbacterium sp.]
MSQPQQGSPKQGMSKAVRGAIYIAIGALVLAAIVCVVWVFVPDQSDLIGRAFLTVLLLAGFSGLVLVDANLSDRRPDWLVLVSIVLWVFVLLVGAFKIWTPRAEDEGFGWTAVRVFELLLVVGVLQLTLLHQRLYWKAHTRYVTVGTRVIAIVTTVFLFALAGMLVFYLAVPRLLDYPDWYWRVVVAVTILASVGTLILPLLNALFAPKQRRPVPSAGAAPGGVLPWPVFPDGVTPLPYLPDGQPDWAAAQTGTPSPGARMWGAGPQQQVASAPAAPPHPAAYPPAQPPAGQGHGGAASYPQHPPYPPS